MGGGGVSGEGTRKRCARIVCCDIGVGGAGAARAYPYLRRAPRGLERDRRGDRRGSVLSTFDLCSQHLPVRHLQGPCGYSGSWYTPAPRPCVHPVQQYTPRQAISAPRTCFSLLLHFQAHYHHSHHHDRHALSHKLHPAQHKGGIGVLYPRRKSAKPRIQNRQERRSRSGRSMHVAREGW